VIATGPLDCSNSSAGGCHLLRVQLIISSGYHTPITKDRFANTKCLLRVMWDFSSCEGVKAAEFCGVGVRSIENLVGSIDPACSHFSQLANSLRVPGFEYRSTYELCQTKNVSTFRGTKQWRNNVRSSRRSNRSRRRTREVPSLRHGALKEVSLASKHRTAEDSEHTLCGLLHFSVIF
jgi:hypothetical protein